MRIGFILVVWRWPLALFW